MPTLAYYLTNWASKLKSILDDSNEQLVSKGQPEVEDLSAIPASIGAIQVGVDTSDATAAASDIFKDKAAYVNGQRIVGIVEKESTSVEPSYSVQEVTPTPGNVLEKVTVGALKESVVDTSDATAAASDIFKDEIAYVNGQKVVGTVEREIKTVTPSTEVQEIVPTKNGNVLGKVIVKPYQAFTSGTAVPSEDLYTITLENVDLVPESLIVWTEIKYQSTITTGGGYCRNMLTVSALYDDSTDTWTTTYANAIYDQGVNPSVRYIRGDDEEQSRYSLPPYIVSIVYDGTSKFIAITINPYGDDYYPEKYRHEWRPADGGVIHWMVAYKTE